MNKEKLQQTSKNELNTKKVGKYENNQFVQTYKAPWLIYGLAISANKNTKIAIGSFEESLVNYMEVLELSNGHLIQLDGFQHKYTPTKIQWIPSEDEKNQLLATSGEYLTLYKFSNNKMKPVCELINKGECNAPLTGFDWNWMEPSQIGTASIDTTCTIWDIIEQQPKTQLIAHDTEVYDISFTNDENIFVTVGADGSCRQFDLRSLDSSKILHETENSSAIIRVACSKADSNLVALLEVDSVIVTLIDFRQTGQPYEKLNNHQDCVNGIAWHNKQNLLCSVGDDANVFIWDVGNEEKKPWLQYEGDQEITNLSWQDEMIGVCFGNIVQLLKL